MSAAGGGGKAKPKTRFTYAHGELVYAGAPRVATFGPALTFIDQFDAKNKKFTRLQWDEEDSSSAHIWAFNLSSVEPRLLEPDKYVARAEILFYRDAYVLLAGTPPTASTAGQWVVVVADGMWDEHKANLIKLFAENTTFVWHQPPDVIAAQLGVRVADLANRKSTIEREAKRAEKLLRDIGPKPEENALEIAVWNCQATELALRLAEVNDVLQTFRRDRSDYMVAVGPPRHAAFPPPVVPVRSKATNKLLHFVDGTDGTVVPKDYVATYVHNATVAKMAPR